MSYQPPPGQQPGGYTPQQQDPRMGYQPPMGQQPAGYAPQQQGPPRGGGISFVSPGIPLNPLERMAVMLIRIIAWIGLIFVVLAACVKGIFILTTIPQVDGFKYLLGAVAELVSGLAGALIGPAFLFALAVILENIVAWRHK